MKCNYTSRGKCEHPATRRVILTEKYMGPRRVTFSLLCCKLHANRMLVFRKNWFITIERI